MAQLKDSLITGSLRVTDTIFSNSFNLASLTASQAVVTDASKNLISRAITNTTSTSAITASTNLITANTLAYWNGAYSGTSSRLTTLGTISTGVWQGTSVKVGYGGTGTTTAPIQGGIIFGSSTSAYGCTSAGTSGQLLQSAGTDTPTWITATNTNTGSTIVKRDANGDFSARTITADLIGTADYAHSLWQRYNLAKGSNPTDSTLWLSNWFNYQTGTTFNESDRIGGGVYSSIATNGNSVLSLIAYQNSTTNINNAHIDIVSQQNAVPYISVSGQLIVQPKNSTHEGGQIQLVKGPSDSKQCYIDTTYDHFRIHNGTNTLFAVGLTAESFTTLNTGPLWIQAGSEAGGNSNRLTTTDGMPGNMQYNQSRRGTQIYSNGIAFCDPYNGNSNSDAGWIRHQETTGNSGELEIAVGDDGNETIVCRQYKTDNTINRTLTLLDANGNTTIPGSFGVANTSSTSGLGISLYNGAINGQPTYGIMFAGTATFGKCGDVSSDWATYFTMNRNDIRGWIFKSDTGTSGNYASISGRGHFFGSTQACTWIDGQRYTYAAYNVGNATDTGSYWPWMRQTNTRSAKWFSFGILNTSFYWIGSSTSRTENSYDYGMYFNVANGYLQGAARVYSAVWNDFAEMRETDETEPGRVIARYKSIEKMIKTQERLQPAAKIISDTYGQIVGQSDTAKTPIGVAGRVLVYPYRDPKEYKIGDALCAAPNGTADIMSREEIIAYPDRIIGIVDEIPDYEYWTQNYTNSSGHTTTTKVEVKDRIWVYVK